MSNGKLAAYVHVDGRVFGPDDEVPAEFAAQITNPKAWEVAPDPEALDEGVVPVPPKGGAGSGIEAWKKYAEALGVDITGAETRDDVIAAITAAGKPTE